MGVLGNGFIGLVNCINCVKIRRSLHSAFILTGLASSRFCLIWIIIIITDAYARLFSPDMYLSGDLSQYIAYLWIIMNQSNVWHQPFQHLLLPEDSQLFPLHFLWLKGHINKILLLMGCLPISWLYHFQNIECLILLMNIYSEMTPGLFNIYMVYFINFGLLQRLCSHFCLFIFCSDCVLLLYSQLLIRWCNWMLQDSEIPAHNIKAMKILAFYHPLYPHLNGALLAKISADIASKTQPRILVWQPLSSIPVDTHLSYLGNSKLKQASWGYWSY